MRRQRRWALRGLAAGAVALAGHLALLQATGNLHVVAPGEVFRSNQPTPGRLAALVRGQGLRSVLNLRGAAPGGGVVRGRGAGRPRPRAGADRLSALGLA